MHDRDRLLGLLYYAFPVLAPQISADTGWSTEAVTSAFSAAVVVSALAGVSVGRVIDRHGPRWIMTAGSTLGVVPLVVIATAPGLPVFVGGWVLAVVTVPAHWLLLRHPWPARERAEEPVADRVHAAEVLRSAQFWLTGGLTVVSLAMYAGLLALVPLMLERGLGTGTAAGRRPPRLHGAGAPGLSDRAHRCRVRPGLGEHAGSGGGAGTGRLAGRGVRAVRRGRPRGADRKLREGVRRPGSAGRCRDRSHDRQHAHEGPVPAEAAAASRTA